MKTGPVPMLIDCVLRLDDLKDVPRKVDIIPPPNVYAALATAIGVDAIRSCEAHLLVTPTGPTRAHVTGEARARVVQTCVVTLEPIDVDLVAPIDMRFVEAAEVERLEAQARAALASDATVELLDIPETLVEGCMDLGALVQELLTLAVDPYPRKPGVVFEPPEPDAKDSPFAALSGWKPGDPKPRK
jgi:hypothetical protein